MRWAGQRSICAGRFSLHSALPGPHLFKPHTCRPPTYCHQHSEVSALQISTPLHLIADTNSPYVQSQSPVPRKKHKVPTRQVHKRLPGRGWPLGEPRHRWAQAPTRGTTHKSKGAPPAKGLTNREPRITLENCLFPSSPSDQIPGFPKSTYPSWDSMVAGEPGLG